MQNFSTLTIPELERKIFDIETQFLKRHKVNVYVLRLWDCLTVDQQLTASQCIQRYFYYCDKAKTFYDLLAIREILIDARKNIFHALANEKQKARAYYYTTLQVYDDPFTEDVFSDDKQGVTK